MQKTPIEWCFGPGGRPAAGYTCNPIRGCTKEDIDCANCYAMRIASRFSHRGGAFEGIGKRTSKGPAWTGKFSFHRERLLQMLRCRDDGAWCFVNSMSDLFHHKVPLAWIDETVVAMIMTTHLRHVCLTKRTDRMLSYFRDPGVWKRWAKVAERFRSEVKGYGPIAIPSPTQLPAHIWWGMSAGDQRTLDKRIGPFLSVPSPNLVLSIEPIIGEVDIEPALWQSGDDVSKAIGKYMGKFATGPVERRSNVRWVIVGGESGPGRRRARPLWAKQIRDACARAPGCTFFLKQWHSDDMDEGYSVTPVPVGRRLKKPVRVFGQMWSLPKLDGVQWKDPPVMYSSDQPISTRAS